MQEILNGKFYNEYVDAINKAANKEDPPYHQTLPLEKQTNSRQEKELLKHFLEILKSEDNRYHFARNGLSDKKTEKMVNTLLEEHAIKTGGNFDPSASAPRTDQLDPVNIAIKTISSRFNELLIFQRDNPVEIKDFLFSKQGQIYGALEPMDAEGIALVYIGQLSRLVSDDKTPSSFDKITKAEREAVYKALKDRVAADMISNGEGNPEHQNTFVQQLRTKIEKVLKDVATKNQYSPDVLNQLSGPMAA